MSNEKFNKTSLLNNNKDEIMLDTTKEYKDKHKDLDELDETFEAY